MAPIAGVRAASMVVGAWLSIALAFGGGARAQASPFQALAEHLTAPKPSEYRGPTVPWPEAPARPETGALHTRSSSLPLAVHARGEVEVAQVEATLAALERAYGWLDGHGFALPWPDAAGDEAAIDFYLQPGLDRGVGAGVGRPWGIGEVDAAEAFGLLDEALAPDELERCALAALAEAGLLAHDPAEPRVAVAAAGAAAVWLAYGELGCRFDAVRMQAAAAEGPLGSRAEQVDTAALWLSRLLERHDPNGERGLLPGLFEAARQHSEKAPGALHARPSFWQALDGMLRRVYVTLDETLDDAAIELAAVRYSLPAEGGARLGLPVAARVPLSLDTALAALPRRASAVGLLSTYGSAYARVDTPGAQAGTQLRAWLRAELGPRWALSAITFDARGRELGQVSAPARNTHDGFLPVELEPSIASVVLVVTKLPRVRDELPLAREGEDDEHDFELTLDVAK